MPGPEQLTGAPAAPAAGGKQLPKLLNRRKAGRKLSSSFGEPRGPQKSVAAAAGQAERCCRSLFFYDPVTQISPLWFAFKKFLPLQLHEQVGEMWLDAGYCPSSVLLVLIAISAGQACSTQLSYLPRLRSVGPCTINSRTKVFIKLLKASYRGFP